MDEGTTQVGSIVGKLKIDDSQWNQTLDLAEGRARELGTIDPTIKVHAKVDEALAKLAAVDAAATRTGLSEETAAVHVAVAKNRSRIAANDLATATTRLTALEMSGVASAEELANAEGRLERARQGDARATILLAEATAALSLAQNGQIAQQDRTTESLEKTNRAQKTHLQHWQVIAIAIAALIPLLGPLLGWAVAVAGALGFMGAAGVLAVVGISRAMKDGTQVGAEYQNGIRSLKGNLDILSGTAAVSMLQYFRQAVAQINANMPSLNRQVAFFTDKLGSTGNHLLAGVLNSLRALNPLLVTGALLVDQMAAGFEGWTKDGGLQQFADYAIKQIPVVTQVLGSLLTMIFHIVEASAPIGTVVLQALTGLATAINAIPIPILSALIVLVAGTVLGFKAWEGITKIVDRVTVSLTATKFAASGLPGVIIGAALAVGALAIAGGRAAASGLWDLFGQTKTVNEYSAAIRRGNIDINRLGDTLKNTSGFLQDFGNNTDILGTNYRHLYEEAGKLDQALSQADPVDLITSYQQLVVEGEKVGKSTTDIANTFPLATAAYLAATGAADNTSTATAGLTTEQQALAERLGATSGEFVGVVNSSAQTETQLRLTTLQMQLENDAAGLLRNALDLLNGNALDVAQAQTGLAAANNSVTDSMEQNGTAVNGSTEKAVANQQALQRQVESAQQVAAAIAEATDSTAAGTESYKKSKAALEAQLEAQGRLTPELQAYIDKLYALKDLKVPPTKLDIDTKKAQQALDAWIAANANHRIHVAVGAGGTGGITKSDGGTIAPRYMSEGGTASGAGTSRSDDIPTWLSKGEEVIRESSASRARPFLKALNANPDRAMAAAAAAGGSGPVNVSVPVRVINKSGVALRDLIRLEIFENDNWSAVDLDGGLAP